MGVFFAPALATAATKTGTAIAAKGAALKAGATAAAKGAAAKGAALKTAAASGGKSLLPVKQAATLGMTPPPTAGGGMSLAKPVQSPIPIKQTFGQYTAAPNTTTSMQMPNAKSAGQLTSKMGDPYNFAPKSLAQFDASAPPTAPQLTPPPQQEQGGGGMPAFGMPQGGAMQDSGPLAQGQLSLPDLGPLFQLFPQLGAQQVQALPQQYQQSQPQAAGLGGLGADPTVMHILSRLLGRGGGGSFF